MSMTLFDAALEGRVRELEAILAELVSEVHWSLRRGGHGPTVGSYSPVYQQALQVLGRGYPIPERYIDGDGRRYYISTPLGQQPPSEAKAHQTHIRKGGRR